MDLTISEYCNIKPHKIWVNGQELIDVGVHESLEKSLVQSYRLLELNYLKFFKMDNLSKLAILAADCLIKDSELYVAAGNENTAVVFANSSSSLVTDSNYQQTINDPANYFPSPSLFVYTLPNITIGEICIRHKIYGENVFLISRKFDADVLYFYVNEIFERTNTQNCIAGWVECNEKTYEAFLFLVEKGIGENRFETKLINKLYKTK